MRIEKVLREVCKFKGFVVRASRFEGKKMIFSVSERKGSRAICSRCGSPGSAYDRLDTRLFEFIPFWGLTCFFEYKMRRVSCKECGVTVEKIPWASGKSNSTTHFQLFLASWAKLLAWKTVAGRFNTSWDTVRRAVEFVVAYGLAHRSLDGVEAIGVDEVQWLTGHKYLTLVYQLNGATRRLLWVGKERTSKTFDTFFNVMQKFGKAIDKIRAEEARRLKKDGHDPVLKHSRWCFLKRPANLTEKERFKLKDLLKMNIGIIRAYLLKEQFQLFWEYKSPAWAGKYLDAWCRKARRSRLRPMKDIANTLQNHRELMLNWFRAKKQYNSGIVEGLNFKVNNLVRRAFGFRSFDVVEVALYHQMGDLPEPELEHRLW